MFCTEYNVLLDKVCVASSHYYDATQRLALLAAKGTSPAFAEARLECEICHGDCQQARADLNAHRADHGC